MEPQPKKLVLTMKQPFHHLDASATARGGAALVIVLSFLVLITGLVLTIFISVTNESSTAASYASGASSKQLADSAVQLVMATIRDATTSGTGVAWASQPGMIRTYGASTANGSSRIPLALNYYKLYSSDILVLNPDQIDSFDPANDVDPAWDSKPALFTDLNSPVASGANAAPEFPIIDPKAAGFVSGTNSLVEGFSYSGTMGANTVDGVKPPSSSNDESARLPMPVKWLYVLQNGVLTAADASSGTTATFVNAPAHKRPSASNPIVGRIAYWTDDETCKLNVNTACGGVPWEPPIFCSTMDMVFSRFGPVKNEFTRYPGHPATTSLAPVLWSAGGLGQPQMSLFPEISLLPAANSPSPTYVSGAVECLTTSGFTSGTAAESFLKLALSFNPRNGPGGSSLGTVPTVSTTSAVPSITLDSDRLFASVDETIFAMATSGSSRPSNVFAPSLDKSTVEKFRFFLTTSSRAPEVNLFNLPKITMWPEPDITRKMTVNAASPGTAQNRTAVDNLIAFCSTLNKKDYFFTRYDSTSPTNDFASGSRNMVLFNYLNGLLQLPVPGFGAKFDGQAGRNGEQILALCADYIRGAVNLLDTTGLNYTPNTFSGLTTLPYAYTSPATITGGVFKNFNPGSGEVAPLILPDGTKGLGRFPTIKGASLMFIARRANQPPVMVDAAMKPTSTSAPVINPMHPWAGIPPTAVTITSSTVTATNLFPNHPGMPYLSGTLTGGAFAPNPSYSAADPSLTPNQTEMEAIFFLNPVDLAPGYVGMDYTYQIQVDGLNKFKIRNYSGSDVPLFPNVADNTAQLVSGFPIDPSRPNTSIAYDPFYDMGPCADTFGRWSGGSGKQKLNYWSGNWAASGAWKNTNLIVGTNSSASAPNAFGQAFDFKGGDVTVRIYHPSSPGTPIQTITLKFPDATFPTPRLIGDTNVIPAITTANLSFDGVSGGMNSRLQNPNALMHFFAIPEAWSSNGADPQGRYKIPVDTIRSVECKYGDTRILGSLATVPSSYFSPHIFYQDNLGAYNQATTLWDKPWARAAHTLRRCGSPQGCNNAVVGATMHPLSMPTGTGPADYLSLNNSSFSSKYCGDWGRPTTSSTNVRMLAPVFFNPPGINASYPYGSWANAYYNTWPQTNSTVDFQNSTFVNIWRNGGDFDNGPIDHSDGPFINKPNEGAEHWPIGGQSLLSPDYQPQFSFIPSDRIMCANRQVPSPVMFGSLPRGVNKDDPSASLNASWQTLLFCPNHNSQTHTALTQVSLSGTLPTGSQCPDFALLDFFHMPVVEPYAISEPFSTAGKVNMNYQIVPFNYIHRDTALRGILAPTLLTAVPDHWIRFYKNRNFRGIDTTMDAEANAGANWYFRYPIHAGQTLQQFEFRFSQGDIFRSPSEICSLFLYPAKQPVSPTDVATPLVTDSPGNSANILAWWYGDPGNGRKSLTGDNSRERPYAQIYPRLTTKSNSYTVHFRVQMLKQGIPASTPATDPRWAQWDEKKGQVTGEYRGSSLIERYVDPGDTTLPDFATTPAATLESYPDPNNPGKTLSAYKFRVVSTKKFTQH